MISTKLKLINRQKEQKASSEARAELSEAGGSQSHSGGGKPAEKLLVNWSEAELSMLISAELRNERALAMWLINGKNHWANSYKAIYFSPS